MNEEFTNKIDETAASVEEIKNTSKAVIAFSATCAKNFPSSLYVPKREDPGKNFFINSI